MVWKGSSIEDAKRRFVNDRLSGGWDDMSALCAAYGISRQAGYELMRRYEIEGLGCAVARSRAPLEHGRRLDEEIIAAIVECRQDHPTWGPRKLLAYLRRRAPEVDWPAASTIGDHLRRHGLIRLRRRRRPLIPQTRPFSEVEAPNDTWSIDFKGWARTGDGMRFDPLTVSDNHSRFSLECRIMEPVGSAVEAAMERLFRDVGLPARLRADNGSPWGSRGPCGLTRTSVKWVEMGIDVEFINPGEPQENGRHERFHETLQAETMNPPAATAGAQQARFDRFRQEYNEERPHEALGQVPPASVYTASSRAYPRRLEDPHYEGDDVQIRRVRTNGEIKWRGDTLYVGGAFIGELVGVLPTETGDHLVRFATVDLGLIDRATNTFQGFGPPRPGRTKARQMAKPMAGVSPM